MAVQIQSEFGFAHLASDQIGYGTRFIRQFVVRMRAAVDHLI